MWSKVKTTPLVMKGQVSTGSKHEMEFKVHFQTTRLRPIESLLTLNDIDRIRIQTINIPRIRIHETKVEYLL